MIITLIVVIILILGIILERKGNYDLSDIGAMLILLSSIVMSILLIVISIAHATANKTIQQNKMNYDGLCRRYEIVESEYEDVSKSDVIADITAWNIKVYNTKYWAENLWTNWFNPKNIADNLEYIQLE